MSVTKDHTRSDFIITQGTSWRFVYSGFTIEGAGAVTDADCVVSMEFRRFPDDPGSALGVISSAAASALGSVTIDPSGESIQFQLTAAEVAAWPRTVIWARVYVRWTDSGDVSSPKLVRLDLTAWAPQ